VSAVTGEQLKEARAWLAEQFEHTYETVTIERLLDEVVRLRAQSELMVAAIARNAAEVDHCLLCDRHPSIGHREDCLLFASGAAR
jgi:hypothetical protein